MSHQKLDISSRNCLEQFYLTKKFVKLNNSIVFTQSTAVSPSYRSVFELKEQALCEIDLALMLFSEGTCYEWERI